MGEFSLTHLLLLAVIVLIFFGPSRLPALGQSLGKAIRGFKSGLSEIDAEAKAVVEAKPAQTAAPAQLKSGLQGAASTSLSGQAIETETQKA